MLDKKEEVKAINEGDGTISVKGDESDGVVVSKKRDMAFFMKGRVEKVKEEEVIVSKRFKDDEGKVVPFIMKAVDTKEIEKLQKSCTNIVYNKKRQKIGENLDNARFAARLAIESTIFPNFKDPQLLDDYGVADPVDVLKEVLNVGGEYAEFLLSAQRINGYDEDIDLIEEAKN